MRKNMWRADHDRATLGFAIEVLRLILFLPVEKLGSLQRGKNNLPENAY